MRGVLLAGLVVVGCARADAPETAAPNNAIPEATTPELAPKDTTIPPIATAPEAAPVPLEPAQTGAPANVAPANEATATPPTEPTPASTPVPPRVAPDGTPSFDIPRKLPSPPVAKPVSPAAKAQMDAVRTKLGKFSTYAGWQALGKLQRDNGLWDQAAQSLRQEAAMYRAQRLMDAAIIRENEASDIATDVRVFRVRQADKGETNKLYTGAPLEPIIGCYLGAFIDRDDALGGKYFDENWQEHRSSADFERLTGKKHASYFMYVKYGQKFPSKWVEQLKAEGAIPHIAWEPKSLGDVKDDAYLQSWGAALRKLEWPVFIRFAGEMNGSWVPYHGNPALYKQKFALVHRALHRASPRVALIWCVNSVPLGNIDDYYPGDEHCDWVGINVYSVPYFDNNLARPAFNASPLTLLDPIYKKYAVRKPIAICEFAASFRAKIDGQTRISLAQNKMALLYSALPLLYPRIKLIDWFSMDTVRHAEPGRKLNNFQLTLHKEMLGMYGALTTDPYFMTGPEHLAEQRPMLGRELQKSESFTGTARLAVWVKTYVARPKVYARLNGKIIYAQARPGAHALDLDLKGLKGQQKLEVLVYDETGRFIVNRVVWFRAG